MTYQVSSFTMKAKVAEFLMNVPWGQRSDFINKAIENYIDTQSPSLSTTTQNPKAEAMKQNPELPLSRESPQGQNPRIQPHLAQEYAGSKTQSEQAETSAKKPSTKLSHQQNMPKLLLTALLSELSTQKPRKTSLKNSSQNIPIKNT